VANGDIPTEGVMCGNHFAQQLGKLAQLEDG
jgi:hypothetical protein